MPLEKPDWVPFSDFGTMNLPRGRKVELHFHDADEYWFIIGGRARISTEGEEHEVGAGDLVCTRMGDEHEIAEVYEDLLGVYVIGELRGRKRRGHLIPGRDPK